MYIHLIFHSVIENLNRNILESVAKLGDDYGKPLNDFTTLCLFFRTF